jgi:exopolysaccharide production protein ExoQ
MGSSLAFAVFAGFIFWLFVTDSKRRRGISTALWIPLLWLSVIGSRFISTWLGSRSEDVLEGSPLDRMFFLVMIVCAFTVLFRRQIAWGEIIRNNKWLFAYLCYLGISSLWSDYTFTSFKRWTKELGSVLMVLVILSENDPMEAIKAVLSRTTYLLIPLSVLLIKYYPEMGRYYDQWTYQPYFCGVTTDKNLLGMALFVCGSFLCWSFLERRSERRSGGPRRRAGGKKEFAIHILLMAMTAWLLSKAHSSTALACTMLASGLLLALQNPGIRSQGKRLAIYGVLGALLVIFLNETFNLGQVVVSALGRDMTFTGRTEIWKAVLAEGSDPLFGTGCDSFWLGDRSERLSAKYYFHLNEAHNGYLEVYLNTGLIGLTLLLGTMANAFNRICDRLKQGSKFASFRFAFLIATAIYGMTEAIFRLGPLWLVLLLVMTEYPTPRRARYQKYVKPLRTNPDPVQADETLRGHPEGLRELPRFS